MCRPFAQDTDSNYYEVAPIPKIDCPYQKPDSCAGTQSPLVTGCCPTDPTEGAHTTIASTILIIVTATLSVLYM